MRWASLVVSILAGVLWATLAAGVLAWGWPNGGIDQFTLIVFIAVILATTGLAVWAWFNE